jgi:hypothetical protein
MGASSLAQVKDNIGACAVARQLEGENADTLQEIEDLLANAPALPRGAMEPDYRLPVAPSAQMSRPLPSRL